MLALDSEAMHKHLKCIHQASPCGQKTALRAETGTWLVSQPISVTHLSLYVTEKKIGPGTVLCDRIRCCRYLLFNSGTKQPSREKTDRVLNCTLPASVPLGLLPELAQMCCLKNDWQGGLKGKRIGDGVSCCHLWQPGRAVTRTAGCISSRWVATP